MVEYSSWEKAWLNVYRGYSRNSRTFVPILMRKFTHDYNARKFDSQIQVIRLPRVAVAFWFSDFENWNKNSDYYASKDSKYLEI